MLRFAALAFLSLVAQAIAAQCGGYQSCLIHANDTNFIRFILWVNHDQATKINQAAITTTSTVTHVTVINTDLHTTTISTIYPKGYVKPKTNEAGTRYELVTGEVSGALVTGTLVYPTPKIDWPTEFTVNGVFSSGGQCVTKHSAVSSLTAAPEFTDTARLAELYSAAHVDPAAVAKDPKGLGFSIIQDQGGGLWEYNAISAFFPGYPEFTSCDQISPGPNWAGFTRTIWHTGTQRSILYTGGGDTTSSKSVTSSRSGIATPSPSPSPSPTPSPSHTPSLSPTPSPPPTLSPTSPTFSTPVETVISSSNPEPAPSASHVATNSSAVATVPVSAGAGPRVERSIPWIGAFTGVFLLAYWL